MRILYLLIPMALGVAGVALWAFLWAVRTGQFDDPEGDAWRILTIPPEPKGNEDDDMASQPDHSDTGRRL